MKYYSIEKIKKLLFLRLQLTEQIQQIQRPQEILRKF